MTGDESPRAEDAVEALPAVADDQSIERRGVGRLNAGRTSEAQFFERRRALVKLQAPQVTTMLPAACAPPIAFDPTWSHVNREHIPRMQPVKRNWERSLDSFR